MAMKIPPTLHNKNLTTFVLILERSPGQSMSGCLLISGECQYLNRHSFLILDYCQFVLVLRQKELAETDISATPTTLPAVRICSSLQSLKTSRSLGGNRKTQFGSKYRTFMAAFNLRGAFGTSKYFKIK
jgi:hypothetical protein